MKYKYNYFYKITNLLNNHFYYGVHCTNNLDDNYMGSGILLHKAYEKYGKKNFKKDIIKYFDNMEMAFDYEAKIVNEELIKNKDCYNIQLGGKGWNTYYTIVVKDKDGNKFRCLKDDPKYLSGEYISVAHDQVTVRDNNNNCFNVLINDPRYINGELHGINMGKAVYKNKITNKNELINCKNVDLSIYEHVTKNKVNVKDKYGNYLQVDVNDERYVSGELTFVWKNKKHTEKTKQKMSLTHKKNQDQKGEKNSQFGTCWIYNNKENKKIKKEELNNYIQLGWKRGRKIKKY